MVQPRCPYCNAQGLDKLAARNLGGFSLIYCGQCGAIFGVMPTPQPKKKSKGSGSAPGPLASNPEETAYQQHEPGPPPRLPDTPKRRVIKDQEEALFTPEEALSFWPQPGSMGFYTRIVSEDDEATAKPDDEPTDTKS